MSRQQEHCNLALDPLAWYRHEQDPVSTFPCQHKDHSLPPGLLSYLPHGFHQFVKVPFVIGTNRDSVGDLVDQVKFFNRDLINLVEDIDTGDINTVLNALVVVNASRKVIATIYRLPYKPNVNPIFMQI